MVRSYIAGTREAIRLTMPDQTRCAVTPHPGRFPRRPPVPLDHPRADTRWPSIRESDTLKCLVPDNWSGNFDDGIEAVGVIVAVQYEGRGRRRRSMKQ